MFQKIFAILSIIALLLDCGAVYASQLPDLGSEFRAELSVADELLIGEHMHRELRSSGMYCKDPLVQEYVRYLGNRLTPHMPTPYDHIRPRFFALEDRTINAFAFFGAHVAINTGLIEITESENEIAGVLAHELAHVAQQHLVRMVVENKRMLPMALAGSIAAVVLAGPEMIIPVLAGHMQHMVNFTRQNEQEADRIGMQILAKAKFDPHGLPMALERLSDKLRYEAKIPEYLRSHPLFESRISDTHHRADTLPATRKTDSPMYNLIKARILVANTHNLQQLIHDLSSQIKSARHANELATKYAYAYALLQLGKNAEALKAIYALVNKHPDNLIVQMTAADIEASNHKYKEAQMRLEQQLELHADSESLQLQYIDLLIKTSQVPHAINTLENLKAEHQPDIFYYSLRRQAEGLRNNKVGVHEANAELLFLAGNYPKAIAELQIALQESKIDLSSQHRINTRITAITDLQTRLDNV